MPRRIDANVPINVAGKAHLLKAPRSEVLELVAQHSSAFVIDAEVLQELLHRYLSLRFWPNPGLIVVECFEVLMRGYIEAVDVHDVLVAAHSAHACPVLSARDQTWGFAT